MDGIVPTNNELSIGIHVNWTEKLAAECPAVDRAGHFRVELQTIN